jgi:hypothetical protein
MRSSGARLRAGASTARAVDLLDRIMADPEAVKGFALWLR